MTIFNSIHETVIDDIFEIVKDGIGLADYVSGNRSVSIRKSNSLARATSGLTLVFPVICTNTLTIETASMIAKAIERKNVAMLQIAFSAYNITNATDAIEHLSKFHTNLNTSKMDLDKFMNMMDSLGESYFDKSSIAMVNEDCKRYINYVFDEDINQSSLLEFVQYTDTMGKSRIVKEAIRPTKINAYNFSKEELTDDELFDIAAGRTVPGTYSIDPDKAIDMLKQRGADDDLIEKIRHNKEVEKYNTDKLNQDKDEGQKGRENQSQIAKDNQDNQKQIADDDRKSREDIAKADLKQKKKQHDDTHALNTAKALGTAADQIRQAYTQQLIPSDVKKANEMQPSLLLVNFYVNDADKKLNIAQQAVAGVKSKLYAVDSADIITRIVTKHADSNVLLKLIRVGTRELSFVKDFLLGLDQARLDALSKSRRGSGNVLFKALERRAIKGRIRKSLRLENSAKAISTLVISSEEADDLKKYNDIDIMEPRNIIPIMEKLNLLYFVVVDTVGESISIITDGESEYESYSFTSLEREAGDGAYKKVVNLMTKLN